MACWARGIQTVQFLVDRNRLESFEAEDLAGLTEALIGRAELRVETTATAALAGGDVDGGFVAAYDAYRMTAEALLAGKRCVLLAATGRTWLWRMPCRRNSGPRFRHSRSRRSRDSGGRVMRRNISILPRHRSLHQMPRGQSGKRRKPCRE